MIWHYIWSHIVYKSEGKASLYLHIFFFMSLLVSYYDRYDSGSSTLINGYFHLTLWQHYITLILMISGTSRLGTRSTCTPFETFTLFFPILPTYFRYLNIPYSCHTYPLTFWRPIGFFKYLSDVPSEDLAAAKKNNSNKSFPWVQRQHFHIIQ